MRHMRISADHQQTIDRLKDQGLTDSDIRQAASVARGWVERERSHRDVSDAEGWRYFCGVAWRMVTDESRIF